MPSSAEAPAASGAKTGAYRHYQKFDAAALKLTLQTILDWKTRPDQKPGQTAIDHVARRLNQSPQYVASWVHPDGSPGKKMYYLARLDGYETHRAELKALLLKLGHREAAEALPTEAPARAQPPAGTSVTRRPLTATDVLNLLGAARAGRAVPEMMEEFHQTKSTVNRWTGKTKWQGENLAQSLSRMEGYATHRSELQALAGELGLHEGELPEPAAQRKQHVTAERLCIALACLADRLERPQPGQNKDTLEAIGKAAGLVKSAIAKWLKADGSPRIALASLARLPDYEQRRGELQGLLERLKHGDIAARLPETATSSRTLVTAQLLVQALEEVGKGARSIGSVSAALDLGGRGLGGFIAIKGEDVRIVDAQRIAGLADYRSELPRLRQAFLALGLKEAARQLPAAPIGTVEFLQALRGKGPEAAAAIADLRRDRSLSPADAARRHGLPEEAFAVAVRPGGLLCDRGRVEARLTQLEPHLAQGLDDLLAMLQRAAQGDGSASSRPQPTMKRVELAPAAHAPAKVFVVPQGETTGPKRSQLANLYASNNELVHGPRSYEGERDRQALRWLSTVFRLLIPDSTEVQCYFDAKAGSIVVSAGRTRDLKNIQSFLAGGDFRALARTELDKQVDTMSEREYRHVQELFGHLKARRKAEAYDPAADLVFDAILRNAFVVPIQTFRGNGRDIHLHAERRLNHWSKQTYGEPLDPARLAGTMRPCGTCADDLKLDDKAHRGPFWLSAAAQAKTDTEAAIQRQIDRSIGTSVTRTRERRLTVDVDTDSDSDA